MGKSGNDVVLSWSGGSGAYDVIRSSAFRMSASTDFLQTGTTTNGFSDVDPEMSVQILVRLPRTLMGASLFGKGFDHRGWACESRGR